MEEGSGRESMDGIGKEWGDEEGLQEGERGRKPSRGGKSEAAIVSKGSRVRVEDVCGRTVGGGSEATGRAGM